jgi:sortase A
LRRLSTVLIVAGVVVLADALTTVVWLEPVTALRAKAQPERPRAGLIRLEDAGPTLADLQALSRAGLLAEARADRRRRARDERRRVPVLARALRRRVTDGRRGRAVARARLDLDLVVVKGSSPGPLRKGPGTFDRAPFPGEHGTCRHRRAPHDLRGAVPRHRRAAQGRLRAGRDALCDDPLPRGGAPHRGPVGPQRAAPGRSRPA